jgi:hypothetical protein
MADSPAERRRGWTPRDRERLSDYERDWTRPLRPEEIREQHHDERSRIIESDPAAAKPKRRSKTTTTKRKPRMK